MTNENDDKKLTLGKERLGLSRSSEGKVTQSFGHGRSKTVMVEVKKKRSARGADDKKSSQSKATGTVLDNLSEEERQERLRALDLAQDVQEQLQRDLERAEQASLQRTIERRRQEEAQEEEAKAEKEQDASAEIAQETKEDVPVSAPAMDDPLVEKPSLEKKARSEDQAKSPAKASDASEGRRKSSHRTEVEEKERKVSPKQPRERRQAKLTIARALETDDDDDATMMQRRRSLAAIKRSREKEKQQSREQLQRHEKVVRTVEVSDTITVGDLANRMAERVTDVTKSLMKLGVIATQNQAIDADTAQLIIEEFGHKINRMSEEDILRNLLRCEDDDKEWPQETRAPIVTVMGHVDHGKTSLLDALRETSTVKGEAGGITQHIGAYQVVLSDNKKITFLDTPGHEAFSMMRMRGARVTDIVVLVIAADDGVSPQTVEAINHAKAAEVPLIVAITKCDKEGADPQKIRTQLLEHSVIVESMSGETLEVEVSAKQKINLDKLEELILLQADMMDLKASNERMAVGTVIEAKLEKGRGFVATVLVQDGLLRVGDIFSVGKEWGRVRALSNDQGKNIKVAEPGMPVEVIGLQGMPQAGDDFKVFNDEMKARQISEYRTQRMIEKKHALASRGTLEQMFNKIKAGEVKTLPVVIKADAGGSLDAIKVLLEGIGTDEVKVNILQAAVGAITESDVTLAGSVDGLVIGFNVRANPQARVLASRNNVNIQYYSVIYQLADDVKALLGGLLSPELQENFLGYAEIREVFNITKVGKVAGSYVTEGVVKRNCKVRLLRDGIVIHEGVLKTLKRFKDDVKEVAQGYECGIAFESYNDIQVGDVVESFEIQEIQRTLD